MDFDTKMDFDIVLYHSGCPDGFTSAWVFKHYNPLIETKPVNYGNPPPNVEGKRVAIVDFSYDYKTTMEMIKKASYLVILDHHQTAQENLKSIQEMNDLPVEIIFDMKRSGAQISWDYVYPNTPRPWFIDYVGDRDLWLNSLPKTEEISLAMRFDGYFNDFQKLENLYWTSPTLDLDNHRIVIKGNKLLDCKTLEVEQYAKIAQKAFLKTPLGNYIVRMSFSSPLYTSDVGNAITKMFDDCDFAVIYRYDKKWFISLRGGANCNLNLSIIAKSLPTGGGHPKASAFSIDNINDFHNYFEIIEDSNKQFNDNHLDYTNLNNLNTILTLPNMNEYINREVNEYIRNCKNGKFTFQNDNFLAKINCVPPQYHQIVINSIETTNIETNNIKNKEKDKTCYVLYFYYFTTKQWKLTVKISQNFTEDIYFDHIIDENKGERFEEFISFT